VSNKGWLALVIISILLIYGSIIIFRYSSITDRKEEEKICYDIDSEGIPKFLDTNFINLEKIEYIKRFRSGLGASQADDFESCREMIHSFIPFEE